MCRDFVSNIVAYVTRGAGAMVVPALIAVSIAPARASEAAVAPALIAPSIPEARAVGSTAAASKK